MPKVKMKTKKSAAKRFKLSATGKLLRKQTGAKHLLTGKRKRRVRALKGSSVSVHSTDLARVTAQLPNMKYLR